MKPGAYVSPSFAARVLGISHRTVIRWIRRGSLPGRRDCGSCVNDSDTCTECRYHVYRVPLMRRLKEAE